MRHCESVIGVIYGEVISREREALDPSVYTAKHIRMSEENDNKNHYTVVSQKCMRICYQYFVYWQAEARFSEMRGLTNSY